MKFLRILWEFEVYYLIHKTPPSVPIRSQYGPVNAPSHFLRTHFNIIVSYTHMSYNCLFTSGFPTKSPYAPLISPIRATWPAYLILLHLITQ